MGVGGLLGGSVGTAAGWPAFFVGGAADGSNLHLLAPCLPVAGGRSGLGRGVAQAGVSVQGSGSEDREEQAECTGGRGGRARKGGGESKREGKGAEGNEAFRKEGCRAGWEEQRGRRGGERRGKE